MLFREQMVVWVVIDTQHLLSELSPGQPNERKTVDFLLTSEYSTHCNSIQERSKNEIIPYMKSNTYSLVHCNALPTWPMNEKYTNLFIFIIPSVPKLTKEVFSSKSKNKWFAFQAIAPELSGCDIPHVSFNFQYQHVRTCQRPFFCCKLAHE